jgi:hypothetical protein
LYFNHVPNSSQPPDDKSPPIDQEEPVFMGGTTEADRPNAGGRFGLQLKQNGAPQMCVFFDHSFS